jgi:DNA-binding NarL/FixJ family response regulator
VDEADNSDPAVGEPAGGEPAPIRLLVVEDHAALGEALLVAFGFEAGIEPIGVAPTVVRALEMVKADRPDVVLMDVRLPDGSGLDAAAQVVSLRPGTAVVIMTAHADHQTALQAADAGAAGFILKDVRMAKIVAGVRRAVAGEPAIDPTMLQSILTRAALDGPAAGTAPARVPELPADERTLIELMAQAVDGSAIATALGMSEDGITDLTISVRERLGARSAMEALVRAARIGLLPGPDQDSRARISSR